ncbi:alpha/beta hydrolase [Streptomyces sp. NBC_00996]|nr:alpha/beta hydrolase [Streptomyces sp. NBC_00996]
MRRRRAARGRRVHGPQAAAERATEKANRNCESRTGPIPHYVDTVDVTRDTDVLRAAPGDPKLNCLGTSYGARIGAVYAARFRQRAAPATPTSPARSSTSTTSSWRRGSRRPRLRNQWLRDCVLRASVIRNQTLHMGKG